MHAFPRDDHFDSSSALLADPYRYISRRCQQLGSDVFEASIMLTPTLCLTGPAAAELFYQAELFQRAGAAPEPLRATLFGKDTLQGLDDTPHMLRKAIFMQITSAAEVAELRNLADQEWRAMTQGPRAGSGPVVLYDLACTVMTRAVCRWAGIPLPEADVARRSSQLRKLYEEAANSLTGHVGARMARAQAEDWLQDLIERHRLGDSMLVPDRPAARIALQMRQPDGERLPARVAAQELLNLLRPTVAVAVYIVFGAHALLTHPDYQHWITAHDGRPRAFVEEVRRHYPFFPTVVARTRTGFDWRDYHFEAGRRVMLDLYGTNHDVRTWNEPERFLPERFWHGHAGVTAYNFIPQGGGDTATGHRCPGEGIVVELVVSALALIWGELEPQPLPQDLSLDMSRLPALPHDRLILQLRPPRTTAQPLV